MLRVLISGLLLSSIKRTTIRASPPQSLLRNSRALTNTCPKLEIMNEQPFEKMAEEGVPQCSGGREKEMKVEEAEKALPKLSAAEFKRFNRMAEHMNYFHEHFRRTWTLLHTACTTNTRPKGMSIRTFLSTASDFAHHLTVHHTIEEQHIFPVLARKMPAFKKELQLLTQHKEIHKGLEVFEKYVEECQRGERELRLDEFGAIMDGFGGVLWEHLDEEVRELGAENMRKYWTMEEIARMPM